MIAWWNGWNDIAIEGQWVSYDGKNESKIQSWLKGEPNNYFEGEHCALSICSWFTKDKVAWIDVDCNVKPWPSALCEIPRSPLHPRLLRLYGPELINK